MTAIAITTIICVSIIILCLLNRGQGDKHE